MKHALYAGSFDPFTNGHLDILSKAVILFDKVTVGIAVNSIKSAFMPVDARIEAIGECISKYNNAEVVSYKGLTVDFAEKIHANFLVRGIRNSNDYEYEYSISQTNKSLKSDIISVFLFSEPQNSFVSSSIVRELITNNADISNFVPNPVLKYLPKR